MKLEEKQEILGNIEELMDEEQQSLFSFQNIFAMLVLNWQWFFLSLFIFLCGALLYLRYTEPVYQLSSRMLIKEDDQRGRRSSQMLANMQDLGFMTNSAGIDNEIEVLQSRVLLRDVVRELKLYTEYRTNGRIRDFIVYGNQPVNVDLDPASLDSLDKALLEGGMVGSLNMQITRTDEGYKMEGKVFNGGSVQIISRVVKALPASFKTAIGTMTLTEAAGRTMEVGEVSKVTLVPPMQVATRYLGSLTVSPTSKMTDIAEITLKDKNVRRGMDFLRHLAECYNRQANADKNEIALRTEEFINDRIEKINAELGTTEGELESFKRRNAVTNISVDASQSVQMSSQFSTRLSEANSQIQMLDYLREFVNNPKNHNQIIPSNVGLTDAASTRLIADYNQAVQNRNRLLQAASEMAPQVQTLNATISDLQASIQTALLQARRSADIARQGIQSEYSKYQGRISSAPVQERVLTQIGRQQDVKSGLYLMLLQKREENSISLAATADKGRLLDEPLINGKVSPKNAIILLAALVIGFLLPMLVLYLLAFFRYKIEGHDDVARLTSMPIVADVAVASDSVKSAAGIVVQANKNNQIDEIFRSMRTNIQFMLKENQKVILFTSSTAGEGKTFNAANLAVSFALLGKKVVLCGLDIRKPALGRLFGISDRKEGITHLLKMDKVTEDALNKQICPSLVNENLDLLLAGAVPPNPAELLARDCFEQTINLLRERYDYVILDTAPVGLVTDTLQIGRVADVTVFVCRADYTPKSSFGLLNTLAKEQKLPNPCVVLNGVDMSKRKYGYYYGYGKYGKYGRYGYGRYGYGRYGYGRYGYGNYGNYGQYGRYAESHYGSKDDDSIKK
jgi:capsular exopolysaccharide synthesis family protein